MEKLTEDILPTLIGKTIYWQLPDGREGICTIDAIEKNEINSTTLSGISFDRSFIDKAFYKSYGRFLKV